MSQDKIQCGLAVKSALQAATDPILEEFFGKIRWLVIYAAGHDAQSVWKEIGRFPFSLAEWDGRKEYETEKQGERGVGTLVTFEDGGGECLFYFTGPGFSSGEGVVVQGGCKPLMRLTFPGGW